MRQVQFDVHLLQYEIVLRALQNRLLISLDHCSPNTDDPLVMDGDPFARIMRRELHAMLRQPITIASMNHSRLPPRETSVATDYCNSSASGHSILPTYPLARETRCGKPLQH